MCIRDRDKSWPETGAEVPAHVKEEVQYQMFLQYVFYCQWMAVKKAANDAGIRIMGDVPFYVGVDSVDEMCIRDRSLLHENLHRLLMTPPMTAIMIFTILPLIFMICMAFTNYSKIGNHLMLFDWVCLLYTSGRIIA